MLIARPFFIKIMGELRELANKFKIDVIDVAEKVLSDNEKFAIGQLQRQMFSGLKGNDEEIEPFYRNKAYALDKPSTQGRDLLTPNLRDTGAFYRSFFAKIQSGELTFDASDSKADDLFAKYNTDGTLMKLGNDSTKRLRENINPKIANEIIQKIR